MKLDSLEEAKEEKRRRSKDTELYFAIVLKETGKAVGEIDACPDRTEPEDDGTPPDTFSPCWMLNGAYHRKGYMYEAACAFFDYLFRHKGARRIYTYSEDCSTACQRLCEKLGMRREGLFLEFVSCVKNPDWTPLYENTMQYAILKWEWDCRSKSYVVDFQDTARWLHDSGGLIFSCTAPLFFSKGCCKTSKWGSSRLFFV